MTTFTTNYHHLNSEQKQAVDNIEGPMMVVAGPGTGKTQTITMRIANILQQTDTAPDSILALTFTDSGAKAMQTRLASFIGSTAYYVNISTFHSFATSIIHEYNDYFTLDISLDPLSDLEKFKLIHQLIDSSELELIRPAGSPYHYAKAILSSISSLKSEGISPSDFNQVLTRQADLIKLSEAQAISKTKLTQLKRNLLKNQDLLIIYQAYQNHIINHQRYDFDDMISITTQTLQQNQDLLLELQERFQYFLVDEYQDTNNAQNKLLFLLASHWGQAANLMVTGDTDQSIMRFQGASLANQLSFIDIFPKAKVITLKTNYRSTQTILDSANSLISHNNLRINDIVADIDSQLISTHGQGNKINLAQFNNALEEHTFLATDIIRHLESGTSPNEIAIIYRTNQEVDPIINLLNKYKINYTLKRGDNILQDPIIIQFLTLLKVIVKLKLNLEDEDLFTLLHHPIFQIEPLDILKLARLANSKRLSLFDVIYNPQHFNSIPLESPQNLTQAISLITHFNQVNAQQTLSHTFEVVLNESGFLTWILKQPNYQAHLFKLNTLFDEVKRMNKQNHQLKLDDFLANLELMLNNNLQLKLADYANHSQAITLTTAHSAKGLEWDVVYITKVVNGVWGNNRPTRLIKLPESIIKHAHLDKKERNEDERRLFYVALTRGRKSVTLTYAQEYTHQHAVKQTTPSMFIDELGDAHLHLLDTSKIKSETTQIQAKLLTSSEPIISPKQAEIDFLTPLIDELSLSATSLNVYLDCPYKFKLDKLFRVPHSKKPHLAFGTAIHFALEAFYAKLKSTSSLPNLTFLLTKFKLALQKEVLNQLDYNTRLKQGNNILTAYYNFFKADFKKPLFLEKSFKVNLGNIPLTGKIDRLEWLDESRRLIKVVDYKTGQRKTKGQILGTTKHSRGNLKRQLSFYRLLIELDTRLNQLYFGEGELDFIESPFKDEKSGKVSLSVSDTDLEVLKSTIEQVVKDIKAFKFPKTKDLSQCAKCDFYNHCFPYGLPQES